MFVEVFQGMLTDWASATGASLTAIDRQQEGVADRDISIIDRDGDGGGAALVGGGSDVNRAVYAAAAQGNVSVRHKGCDRKRWP